MKKNFLPLAYLCISMLFCSGIFGQQNDHSMPAWVSNHGYWVLETSGTPQHQQTIRFYNNAHALVATRQHYGRRLNIQRKNVKLRLKGLLEQALEQWAAVPAELYKDSSGSRVLR